MREPAFRKRFGAAPIRFAQPRGNAPEPLAPLRLKAKGEVLIGECGAYQVAQNDLDARLAIDEE